MYRFIVFLFFFLFPFSSSSFFFIFFFFRRSLLATWDFVFRSAVSDRFVTHTTYMYRRGEVCEDFVITITIKLRSYSEEGRRGFTEIVSRYVQNRNRIEVLSNILISSNK